MKFRKLLLGSVVCVCLSSPVYANMWEKMNVDEKIRKMKGELNLTQEQTDQIRPIMEDYKDAMEKARKDKEDRLNGILTPDQMNQLKTMHKDKYKEDKD